MREEAEDEGEADVVVGLHLHPKSVLDWQPEPWRPYLCVRRVLQDKNNTDFPGNKVVLRGERKVSH